MIIFLTEEGAKRHFVEYNNGLVKYQLTLVSDNVLGFTLFPNSSEE